MEFIKGQNNFSLGVPAINKMQVSDTEVKVTGSILAFDLLNSPAELNGIVFKLQSLLPVEYKGMRG